MKKYWTVAAMNWQESLTYRFNAFIWVLYAVLPSLTLMLVWRAKYAASGGAPSPGGLTLPQMMTYYFFITALSVVITPHPEWDIAMQIRDGKITSFIVRPIGFYGYRLFQETAYQVLKSLMLLPALGVMLWIFHRDLRWPPFEASRFALFLLSALLAYGLLTQIKFLLGLSAFWISEPGGFLELWHTLISVLGGRLLPIGELAQAISVARVCVECFALHVAVFVSDADFFGHRGAAGNRAGLRHSSRVANRAFVISARDVAARIIGLRRLRRLKAEIRE